jgi:hypothetical protein
MQQIDSSENLKVRNPGRPDDQAGLALPHRTSKAVIFQGWGPRLSV